MNIRFAFLTMTRFALVGATTPEERLALYDALGEIGDLADCQTESEAARAAAHSLREADKAQLFLDEILSKEAAR